MGRWSWRIISLFFVTSLHTFGIKSLRRHEPLPYSVFGIFEVVQDFGFGKQAFLGFVLIWRYVV